MNVRVAFILATTVAVVLATVADIRGRKIERYELAFAQIANDMQINYGLHQGALEKLKTCQ